MIYTAPLAASALMALTTLATAECVTFGVDLEVCGTDDMPVTANEYGVPLSERTVDQRLTQVFWTMAGEPIETEHSLEDFFWDMWGLVGDRLERHGTLDYGWDYTNTINGTLVFGNRYTLRPEDSSHTFIISLIAFEAHGFLVALEVIEPAFRSDHDATQALIASAMAMVHPQGTGYVTEPAQ